jgi:hypothetical protein
MLGYLGTNPIQNHYLLGASDRRMIAWNAFQAVFCQPCEGDGFDPIRIDPKGECSIDLKVGQAVCQARKQIAVEILWAVSSARVAWTSHKAKVIPARPVSSQVRLKYSVPVLFGGVNEKYGSARSRLIRLGMTCPLVAQRPSASANASPTSMLASPR